jgi:hypothetical protein
MLIPHSNCPGPAWNFHPFRLTGAWLDFGIGLAQAQNSLLGGLGSQELSSIFFECLTSYDFFSEWIGRKPIIETVLFSSNMSKFWKAKLRAGILW